MSIGAMGFFSGAAAIPAAQSQGADAERQAQDATTHARGEKSAQQAEAAAGVGQTQADQEASDRDADGRRPWEFAAKVNSDSATNAPTDLPPILSKDPTGECGQTLDLNG